MTSDLGKLRIDARFEIERIDHEFAELRRRAQLSGFELIVIDVGQGESIYYCQRWGRLIELADLGAVAEFLRRVGAIA